MQYNYTVKHKKDGVVCEKSFPETINPYDGLVSDIRVATATAAEDYIQNYWSDDYRNHEYYLEDLTIEVDDGEKTFSIGLSHLDSFKAEMYVDYVPNGTIQFSVALDKLGAYYYREYPELGREKANKKAFLYVGLESEDEGADDE